LISLLYITPISLGDIAFVHEIKEALLTPEEEGGGGREEEEEGGGGRQRADRRGRRRRGLRHGIRDPNFGTANRLDRAEQ
jgi:hypothetical protein